MQCTLRNVLFIYIRAVYNVSGLLPPLLMAYNPWTDTQNSSKMKHYVILSDRKSVIYFQRTGAHMKQHKFGITDGRSDNIPANA
jgi:hypothetical protein